MNKGKRTNRVSPLCDITVGLPEGGNYFFSETVARPEVGDSSEIWFLMAGLSLCEPPSGEPRSSSRYSTACTSLRPPVPPRKGGILD